MEATQVRIHLEMSEENNTHVIKVTSIRLLTGDITYSFPAEYQSALHHAELFNIGIIKSACKVLTKKGHYRNLTVTLPKEIVSLYMDADQNFVFQDNYLEEVVENKPLLPNLESSQNVSASQTELIEIIDKLTSRLNIQENKKLNISQIEKCFILNKFQGKENAAEWLDTYEKECIRHEITTDENKIQVLRLFLEKNVTEWYASTLCKLTIQGKWTDWRNSFLQTYSDKSWRSVYFAYNFKYRSGSLLDYALKKERLLLETEPLMSDTSRINHVVVGLPFNIQDRLDKEEIITTEQLMNQLRRFNVPPLLTKYNKGEIKSGIDGCGTRTFTPRYQKPSEKKPCPICESRGYPGRFHPAESCRYKDRKKEKQVNLSEMEDLEINFQDQKN